MGNISMLDMEIIQETLEDGADLLEEMMEMFDEAYAEEAESLQQAADQGDGGKLSEIAHKLKGECASLGFIALSEKYKAIEIKGKNNDLSGIESLFLDLDDVYEQTISEVQKLL